jgi:hypothetical protein
VRWRSFNILLVQAAVALIMLHTAVNDLLPALPGSELKHAPKPPPIDAARCVLSLGSTHGKSLHGIACAAVPGLTNAAHRLQHSILPSR